LKQDIGDAFASRWIRVKKSYSTFLSQVLRIRPDHVIEQMLHSFGADLRVVEVPFQPEGGAYSVRGHSHDSGDAGHHHE
jgi:hypothetical protein